MELGVRTTSNFNCRSEGIHKQVFQLKQSRRDGLVLQVHHTVPTNGEIHRVRFIHLSFDDASEQLAAADHRGNIFIIDFQSNRYWMLPNLGCSCSVIGFSSYNRIELVVGLKDGSINVLHTELGTLTGKLLGHTQAATQISFSSDSRYCLSASSEEGIIWDLKSNSQAHRLSMRSSVELKKVLFMPVSNNVLACFQDDNMHVWKFETFECLKQIIPEAWKSHHLKAITFTRDGRAMIIGGHTSCLVVFALDNWTVKKVIELPSPIPGVKHLELVPQIFDGGASKILAILPTDHCSVRFLDIETSEFLSCSIEPECSITKFACSSNGKLIACVLHSGEVNIYNCSKLLQSGSRSSTSTPTEAVCQPVVPETRYEQSRLPTAAPRRRHSSRKHMEVVRTQIKETLGLERLRPILKEFGEYPAMHRALIWRTILQLPENQSSYVSLVNRGCHPAYSRLEESYPLENKATLKNFKRLLSNLAHWSPVFGEAQYIPMFVFPFVRVFQNDPIVCFEAVATILVNWCQHWFQYFPHPPVGVLAMIEKVLAAHDPELMEHFYAVGVTSQLYAWSLLENAFTEVLSQDEWLRLWDHVLSNEPTFLLMLVVSYNIAERASLKACAALDDFQFFFHNQNAVDMKRLISKAYSLCSQTSEDIHPRQYLKDFQPIEKGSYPIFNSYPKFIVDYQAQQMEFIRQDEDEIVKDEKLALELKLCQERRLRKHLQGDVEAERLQKLEAACHEKLQSEEDRVSRQRQKVLALRQELRSREAELLEAAKEKIQKQHTQQRTVALERLMDGMSRKAAREDTEIAMVEEEMRRHYAELLGRKHELELELEIAGAQPLPGAIEHRSLQQQQDRLRQELRKLRDESSAEHHARQLKIASRLAQADELMQRNEMELAMEVAQRQQNLVASQANLKLLQSETKTKSLEEEVDMLLKKVTEIRSAENLAKKESISRSLHESRTLNDSQQQLIRDHHAEPRADAAPNGPRVSDWRLSGSGEGKSMPNPRFQLQNVSARARSQAHSLHSAERHHLPTATRSQSGISVRSLDYYSREQGAVQSAMNVREGLLSADGVWKI